MFEALEDRRLLAPVAGDRNPYDIDGDGTADPLSDGILVIRYLAGFTGDALMQGVVNSAGSRADEASIMARLATIEDSFLDPDGDVNNLPLSDGILIVRHLAGFDDDTLVSGAANLEQGIRRSPTTIQKYLDQPINEPPQGTTVPFGLNEDGQLDVLAADGLLKNVSDPDGDAIVAKLGTPAGNGTVEVQPNGSFSYIPNADFFGTDSFTFIASDEFGAEAELLVQIAVASVNDPPVVIEQAFETPNDNLLQVTKEQGLLKAATDAEGDTLAVSLIVNAEHGVVTLEQDGAFQYQPAVGFFGEDLFHFGITDGQSPIVEAMARIHVFATNTKPVARNLEYFVDEDGVLTIDTNEGIAVKGGFDADGDSLQISRMGPDHGKFDYSLDGSFTYVPDPNFNGQDFVTYAVRDDDGNESNEATVTLTVRPIFDPPTLIDDVRDTAVNSRLQIDGGRSVLANDILVPDLDVDTAVMSVTVPPAHGTIVNGLDENDQPATFYLPNPGFLGTDSFVYGVSEGGTVHGQATVTISVTPRGDILFDSATGVATIFGRETADRVEVIAADATTVFLELRDRSTGQTVKVVVKPAAELQRVDVFLFAGDDVFQGVNFENNDKLSFRVFGGDGDDLIVTGGAADYIEGNAGFDQIFGGAGDDVVYGNHPAPGVPVPAENSGDLLVGGDGNDILVGTDGFDTIYGGNGNDRLFGFAESDSLYGDLSTDPFTLAEIIGNLPGDDELDGGDGDDFLEGGRGTNHLNGGKGADTYAFLKDLETVGSRHNLVDQFSSPEPFVTDQNALLFTNFNDPAKLSFGLPVVYDMNKSENRILLPAAPADNNELIISLNDTENFLSIVGGSANDLISGRSGRVNTIDGSVGDDVIYGGDVRDTLKGGPGKDTIFGGGGDDSIDGGAGENKPDNIAFGGPGDDNVVNATEVDTRIQVTTFTNTPTQFGNKFISVTINGTDKPDLVLLTASGTTLTVDIIVVIDKNAGQFETETKSINFAGAYLDWKFIGGPGDDEYRDQTNLRSIDPRFAAFGGTVYGGEGNDLLIGGDGIDLLKGGPGNDTLEGRGGNDTLEGGGSDVKESTPDDDTYVFSGSTQGLGVDFISEQVPDGMFTTLGGFDTLDFRLLDAGVKVDLRRASRNTLFQFRGNDSGLDRVLGSRFADEIFGTERNDVLEGNDGDDRINGLAGDDVLKGGRGIDVLIGGLGTDTIDGGEGDDFIFGYVPNDDVQDDLSRDELHGGAGNDEIHGSAGRNDIFGDEGDDKIFGYGGKDHIVAGTGDDFVNGGSGGDLIFGNDGHDELFGGTDDDEVHGGEGSDDIDGGEGNDLLFGDDGDDVIYGRSGNDKIVAAGGDDFVEGGSGSDLIFGSAGNDDLYGESGDDEIQGGDGNDYIDAGGGNDLVFGDKGADALFGGSGKDELQGGDDDDELDGGSNDDRLFGGDGNDTLFGDASGDVLVGGFGQNNLLTSANLKQIEKAYANTADLIGTTLSTAFDQLNQDERNAVAVSLLENMQQSAEGLSLTFSCTVCGKFAEKGKEFLGDVSKVAKDVVEGAVREVSRVADNVVNTMVDIALTVGGTVAAVIQDTAASLATFVEKIATAKTPEDFGSALWILTRDTIVDGTKNVALGYLQVVKIYYMTIIREYVFRLLPPGARRVILEANVGEIYYDNNPQLSASDKLINLELGGAPLYHVNGVNTQSRSDIHADTKEACKFEAFEEAESVSLQLARKVQLIYNDTEVDAVEPGKCTDASTGIALDIAQAALDLAWAPPLPQHNATTRKLAGILLQHARNNVDISISAHSQGTLIVRNALRTLIELGEDAWVENQVRVLFVGSPLSITDVAGITGQFLTHKRDPVASVGRPTLGQGANGQSGFTATTGINRVNHNLVRSYIRQYNIGMFFPAGNGLRPHHDDPSSVSDALDENGRLRLAVYERYLNGDLLDPNFEFNPF